MHAEFVGLRLLLFMNTNVAFCFDERPKSIWLATHPVSPLFRARLRVIGDFNQSRRFAGIQWTL
jgi:hypothetical protein